MADKLGPGSYNFLQSAIETLILQMNSLLFQRTKNSEEQQLLHKYSSNDISDIELRYGSEIDYVRNEMRGCDDKTSGEYFELMTELEELEDSRDREITAIEDQDNEREKDFEQQNIQLETRYEAVKSDKEGLEKAQEENIQRQ